MSLLRLILFGLLFYLALKIIRSFLAEPRRNQQVKGRPNGRPPLDLSDADIEDADFEDLKD